jgi:signal transduction histidine kinase
MAISYVLVTAAAVALVAAAVLGILLPRALASSGQAAKVSARSGADAKRMSAAAANMTAKATQDTGQPPAPGGLLRQLAASSAAAGLGLLTVGKGNAAGSDHSCLAAMSVETLIAPDGTVLASSDPASCPPRTRLAFAARAGLSGEHQTATGQGNVVWALSPVVTGPAPQPTASGPSPVSARPQPGAIGAIYVEEPATARSLSYAPLRPLLTTGALVLALVIPVGLVFGLLSTRRTISRIKRLADVTASVAAGDFNPRVPVSAGDEIGQLEDAFNQMAARLGTALDRERQHAGADARQAERARIARELHDSISQDLFSLSLLAGGLRKALPAGSGLRPEVETMERTAARTMREMQALLLELRPAILEDAGLVPALAELCHAYEKRLGIRVGADLREVRLDPAGEHAVLRVTQEALGNAVRHAGPATIMVSLGQAGGEVTVEVRDDGQGFDPRDVAERHGMGLSLMRERIAELGGEFAVGSRPGEGTAVRIRLPVSGSDDRDGRAGQP